MHYAIFLHKTVHFVFTLADRFFSNFTVKTI